MSDPDTDTMFLGFALGMRAAERMYKHGLLADAEIDAHLKAATPDGWIEWGGGECPVPAETLVEVKVRYGKTYVQNAGYLSAEPDQWRNDNNPGDIIAYRVVDGIAREE